MIVLKDYLFKRKTNMFIYMFTYIIIDTSVNELN